MAEYRHGQIIVRYDESVCTHAGECVRGLPAVFDAKRDPWIDLSRGEPSGIEGTIRRCPSGALTFETIADTAAR